MTMGYFRFFPKVAHVFPPFFKFSLLSNCYRTGRRSNEVTSTRLVGFVDFGSFTSAIAQPPARWVVAAQWPEIRPSLALATWLPAAGRTPSRRHGPAHRDPFRRARLRLSQISHASQFRYFNDGLKKKIGAQCLYNVFYIFTCADVKGLMNRRHVVDAQEQVQQALFDYTLNCYAHIPVSWVTFIALTILCKSVVV